MVSSGLGKGGAAAQYLWVEPAQPQSHSKCAQATVPSDWWSAMQALHPPLFTPPPHEERGAA